MTPADMARALTWIAADLEDRHYLGVGIIRQAAGVLATLEAPAEHACPICHGPIDQPATGRPRRYCSTRCKRTARNRRETRH